ncbi:MAG: xylose isomerase domain protein barrel [Clostridia bacterium]|nr:xylose isomerase domain protein barrel [Clostridia bacterium]
MIRFGGPIFEENLKAAGAGECGTYDDPNIIASAYKLKGYTAAYAPRVSLDDRERISDIKKAFAKENIIIAEVGYWDNITDTDEATRKANMNSMTNALAIAEELGARCAVDIFGSYVHGSGSSKFVAKNFSDDAFTDAVDIARYLIDTVKPKTAYFAYEIFPFNVVDCPEMLEKLIKAVDRKQFGVHLDLANLINCPRTYFTSGNIIRDCVKRFGDKRLAAHVKDIKLKEPANSVILEEVLAGEGGLDMHSFIREINALPQEIPFMMEHLRNEDEYNRAAKYIRKCAADEGISI